MKLCFIVINMIFRILLGLYLVYHFVTLLPDAEELFGRDMLFDYKLSPVYGLYPNVLEYVNATAFIVFLLVVSIVFTCERYPRVCALVLYYGWACLLNRNPLIHNPGLAYVGWILLAMTLVIEDKARVLFHTNNKFLQYIQRDKFPPRIFWAGWILMTLGYTCSGLHKLINSPSWVDGSALQHVLESPLARDNMLRDLIVQYPTFLKYSTWFSLFLEISYLPLGVFYHTRLPYWLLYVGFHMGILCLINFTDLTLGVLTIHMLTFDWRWFNYFAEMRKAKVE